MRKAAVFALTAVLLLSMCACGGAAPAEVPESTVPPEDAESVTLPAVPESTPEPEEAPKDAGIRYTGTASAMKAAYYVLTMEDTLEISADDSIGPELIWLSSDESVAIVENGLVQPVGIGKAQILCSDNKNSGVAIVLVDGAPAGEPTPAGRVMIEKDGTLYESSLPASVWRLTGVPKPGYMQDDNVAVYEADGSFYVRAEYLLNVLCCVLGKCTVIPSPGDGYPQLCGDADIRNAEPPVAFDHLGGSNRLLTTSVVMEFPDGSSRGGTLCTQIIEDDEPTGIVWYHALAVDEDIYPEAGYYFDCYGVACDLRYDEQLQALIISMEG